MPTAEACRLTNVRSRFGATLREWRVRRQLTQEQLAEASGLSYKFIGEVERGRGNPTLDTIARLADALKVEMSRLLEETDRQRPSEHEYRISKRNLQLVREAAASLDSLLEDITESPPYRIKRHRRRS